MAFKTDTQFLTERDRQLLARNGITDPEQWLLDLQGDGRRLGKLRSRNQLVDAGGSGGHINVEQVLVMEKGSDFKPLTKAQKTKLAADDKAFEEKIKPADGTIQVGFNGEQYTVGKPSKDGVYKVIGQKWDDKGRLTAVDMGTAAIGDSKLGVKGLSWKTVVKDGVSQPVKPVGAGESAVWQDPFSGAAYTTDLSRPVSGPAAAAAKAQLPILGGTRFQSAPSTAAPLPTNPAQQALASKYGSSLTQEQGNVQYAAPGAYQTANGGTAYNSAFSGELAGNEVLLGNRDSTLPAGGQFTDIPDMTGLAGVDPTAQTVGPNGALQDQYTNTKFVRGLDGQMHQVSQQAMTVDDQRQRLLTMTPAELKMVQTQLFLAGYFPKSTKMTDLQVGQVDGPTETAWNSLLRDTLSYNAAGVLKTPDDILHERAGIGAANTAKTGVAAATTMDARTAASVADAAALQLFGRKASPDEQRMLIYAANANLKAVFDAQNAAVGVDGPSGGPAVVNPSFIADDVLQKAHPQEAAGYSIVNSMNVLSKILGPAVATMGGG